jgi:uncharacterized protein (DUF58 family)
MPTAAPIRRRRQTVVRKKPSLDFSVTGLVYCTMMMFLGLAAVNSQANLLFGVFGLMIGLLLISGVISKRVLSGLTVRRQLPEHGCVGCRMAIQYHIHNRKRFWPSLSVTFAELDGAEAFTRQPQAYLMHVAPRTTAIAPTEVMPKRRGLHYFDRFQIITSFPFGFIKRAVQRAERDNVLIFPAVGQVDQKVIQMCRSAETTGAMMRPRRGGMDEFYGVKEYRSGENPRWIYWRRSARTGTLVTKEMTHVSPPRMLLLVDTYIAGERTLESHAAVERTIAMAASLASEALEQGLPIGVVAYSSDGWVHIPATRGKRHRLDVLTLLARLPLNTSHDQRQLLDEGYRHLKSGTTSVLLTPSDLRLNLGEAVKGSVVVLSPASQAMQSLFQFDPRVDFTLCMPVDQQVEG